MGSWGRTSVESTPMNAHKLIAITLAALLVFAGGAAALPGQAPDAADEHQPDDPGADASDDADENATDSDDNATVADDARDENPSDGPPTEMPDVAPDHVTQIHDLIRDKLDGTLTGQELGEALGGLMGDGAESNSQDDTASEQSESDASEDAQADAGPTGDLPEQAADRVSGIHDAILSFLNGDDDGHPGDVVSSAAR